jgi:ElaB/YqjD/DUF883 family membrane-anchored ribosome-binding protein
MNDIRQRMMRLERRVEGAGRDAAGRVSARLSDANDSIGDAVAAVLGQVADQFRGGARSMSGEAARFGQEAAKLGNDAVRRLADEVEHRPLMVLAVAAGLGFLAGVAARRH